MSLRTHGREGKKPPLAPGRTGIVGGAETERIRHRASTCGDFRETNGMCRAIWFAVKKVRVLENAVAGTSEAF